MTSRAKRDAVAEQQAVTQPASGAECGVASHQTGANELKFCCDAAPQPISTTLIQCCTQFRSKPAPSTPAFLCHPLAGKGVRPDMGASALRPGAHLKGARTSY